MKKIIYLVCFLWISAFLSNSLQAQTTTFGLRGGVNISNLKNNFYDSSLGGLMGGFYTNIRLGNSKFTFSPELLYTRKGAKNNKIDATNKNGKTVQGKAIIKIDYIEIPILFKYNSPPIVHVNPFLYAGPYTGFKVSAKTVIEIPDSKEQLDKTPISVFDFGLTVGGGVHFGRFNVGIRYEYGLQDIREKNEATKLGPPVKTKNRVFSFVAGVDF